MTSYKIQLKLTRLIQSIATHRSRSHRGAMKTHFFASGFWTRKTIKSGSTLSRSRLISCHAALCKKLKDKTISGRNSFDSNFDLEKNWQKSVFGFQYELGQNWRFSIFLHETLLSPFWRENFKRSILIFLLKVSPGETLCNFCPIFPPNVLVYRGNIFSSHLFFLLINGFVIK